jgi:hypothetical protein
MFHGKALSVGVFLVAAGAVMLAGQDAATREAIVSALRLWPLAVIAIGVGLILRPTRLNLAGAVVAALVPGLLFGGVVAAAPSVDLAGICDDTGGPGTITRGGTFVGSPRVEMDFSCGDLDVVVRPGTSWEVQVRDLARQTATVVAMPDRLVIRSQHGTTRGFTRDGDAWRVELPADMRMELEARVNAGRARLNLSGARLGTLDLVLNAGDARVDLTGATLERLEVAVNAGAARLLLPAESDVRGNLRVAAGALELCIPDGLGVRIVGDAVLGSTTFNGLIRAGDAWETPGYATAAHRADLAVSASAGSVDVNPEGDCK